MQTTQSDISQRSAAIAAGISIVVMAITAGFSYGYVLNSTLVPGDAAATTAKIMDGESLFRAGMYGWIIILICDVIAAWALYVVFKQVNQSLSLLTAWFRLVYAALLGVSLLSFVFVLLLNSGADYLNAFNLEQLQSLMMLFLNAFQGMWQIGLVIFGCHLSLLGYLVYVSGSVPRVIGFLILIAAMGYLIVNSGHLLLPDYKAVIDMIDLVFVIPMIVGELGLGLWLLFKGGKDSGLETLRNSS